MEHKLNYKQLSTHTVRVVFDDTFNGHMSNFGSNRDKTVYTVDSYDNNAALYV